MENVTGELKKNLLTKFQEFFEGNENNIKILIVKFALMNQYNLLHKD